MCLFQMFNGFFSQRHILLLENEFGSSVTDMAARYAKLLPFPVRGSDRIACLSLAQKYIEDEPLSRCDLFPGLTHEDLQRFEWSVMRKLDFNLRR